jgi:hypothetical protein
LSVTATSVSGQRATLSRSFQVDNALTGPGRLYIDQPLPGNTYQGPVQFGGWAVHSSVAVTAVSITIDGVPYGNATYGGSRNDACAIYPGPSCPGIGWTFPLDTTQLADGVHTLGATEIAADGSHYTASSSFTVANSLITNSTRITIDSPTPNTFYSGAVAVSGWALDDVSAIAAVSLAVDGVPQTPTLNYGLSRQDVCTAYPGRSDCPNVGWAGSLDTTLFSNGTHTLTVTATTSLGRSSTLTSNLMIVN